MNWYEHHIGDYDKNTSHLTACEDGIYCRLIRRYMDKEAPLPADRDKVKRITRARDKVERKAVDEILGEFFYLKEDGWHHKTCDELIAAYQSGEPEREVKKANEDNRLKQHRAHRAALFKIITDAGEHAPWNIAISDLRALAEKVQKRGPATPESSTPATQPATAPATPATATQYPVPSTHPPLPNSNTLSTDPPCGGAPAASPVPAPTASPTPASSPTPKPRKASAPAEKTATALAFDAYAAAFKTRYGVEPIRNGTVNGQLSQLVGRVGEAEAPEVARYYVANCSDYASRHHDVGLLLRDSAGIHMRWKRWQQGKAAMVVPQAANTVAGQRAARGAEATGGLTRLPSTNLELDDENSSFPKVR